MKCNFLSFFFFQIDLLSPILRDLGLFVNAERVFPLENYSIIYSTRMLQSGYAENRMQRISKKCKSKTVSSSA